MKERYTINSSMVINISFKDEDDNDDKEVSIVSFSILKANAKKRLIQL